jgi:hypothetical protein
VCAHQGRAAQGIQPAYHRPVAQRRVRALHQHPDEHPALRPLRPDARGLVLRTTAARRPENYTKTAPIQFEEFADVISWWNKREENERAWKVSAAELLANGCNLDRKNPRAKEDITHLPPEQLAADILKKEQRIAEIMGNIRNLLAKHGK